MASEVVQEEYIALREVVRACRLGMEAMAGDRLVDFIDSLSVRLLTLPPAKVNQLTPVLAQVLFAQEKRDYIWMADLLQYQVAPMLYSGRDVDGVEPVDVTP